jgi:hypothetical protein
MYTIRASNTLAYRATYSLESLNIVRLRSWSDSITHLVCAHTLLQNAATAALPLTIAMVKVLLPPWSAKGLLQSCNSRIAGFHRYTHDIVHTTLHPARRLNGKGWGKISRGVVSAQR